MTNQKFAELLSNQIPQDSSQQVTAEYYINQTLKVKNQDPIKVLDLGCGEGNSESKFKAHSPNAEWFGLDIDESPEVNARTKTEGNFYTFDGINIPFADNYFDIVYSNQVFEHVFRFQLNFTRRLRKNLK